MRDGTIKMSETKYKCTKCWTESVHFTGMNVAPCPRGDIHKWLPLTNPGVERSPWGFPWHREMKPAFEVESTQDDIELQLLICDFGNHVCVKIEKGNDFSFTIPYDYPDDLDVILFKAYPDVIHAKFADVRAAIDFTVDEKPPETPYFTYTYDENGKRKDIYLNGWSFQGIVADGIYHAACSFAGKDLPIYEPQRGKWQEIYSDGGYRSSIMGLNEPQQPEPAQVPISIYRYVRRGAK